ncbi:MAG: hypothetical protein A2527_06400 [Candidatus Lambdaproteobacteria bacterium RIFOXYD2_FULL_50_16]|uniref:Orc1-like AAA ATPase domain-containing protein n=1 Tax=Candidatus Lambdaproteobacteria bacterium RIFOXYD2_FULL_50_16 TaxID=1817772 RepID=A0A1F6GA32_9PROT|nr:MAG: hypothetical protein A2527_06400 [Candidatus Lambdaproteobacteria bacterium RIFOXYD2_FULL_50_16]
MENPFRPGAGHRPPFLAGRQESTDQFKEFLEQKEILSNCILTGLRGVGKTVLLNTWRPLAIERGWLWCGNELSESAAASEKKMAVRLLADLSLLTSECKLDPQKIHHQVAAAKVKGVKLDYDGLWALYEAVPGLVSDKLKVILETAWSHLSPNPSFKGVIFAYDEAQTAADSDKNREYPLALILDVFQSIQSRGIPMMLVLAGLPMLFPMLVESRTFAERMFKVLSLDKLDEEASEQAIVRPIEMAKLQDPKTPNFLPKTVKTIVEKSGGYPYFIQFICKEAFDAFIQQGIGGAKEYSAPIDSIARKLDLDFFAARWSRLTNPQRSLLTLASEALSSTEDFTTAGIKKASAKHFNKPLTSSAITQMLATLINKGMVYKNRHGKYSFAVPMFGQFIARQIQNESKKVQ